MIEGKLAAVAVCCHLGVTLRRRVYTGTGLHWFSSAYSTSTSVQGVSELKGIKVREVLCSLVYSLTHSFIYS